MTQCQRAVRAFAGENIIYKIHLLCITLMTEDFAVASDVDRQIARKLILSQA